jgi:hypothetical protein
VWFVVAVIAAALMLAYLYRQIALGKIRELRSSSKTVGIASCSFWDGNGKAELFRNIERQAAKIYMHDFKNILLAWVSSATTLWQRSRGRSFSQ